MEPEVGTIFIAQPLDYEQNKLYKLHVLASDGKWEDYATVIVTIVNKNDEAPVFSVNEYYGSVTEELDGSPVFVLQVVSLISLFDISAYYIFRPYICYFKIANFFWFLFINLKNKQMLVLL